MHGLLIYDCQQPPPSPPAEVRPNQTITAGDHLVCCVTHRGFTTPCNSNSEIGYSAAIL